MPNMNTLDQKSEIGIALQAVRQCLTYVYACDRVHARACVRARGEVLSACREAGSVPGKQYASVCVPACPLVGSCAFVYMYMRASV